PNPPLPISLSSRYVRPLSELNAVSAAGGVGSAVSDRPACVVRRVPVTDFIIQFYAYIPSVAKHWPTLRKGYMREVRFGQRSARGSGVLRLRERPARVGARARARGPQSEREHR